MGCKYRVMDRCKVHPNEDKFCFGKDDCSNYVEETKSQSNEEQKMSKINVDICCCCSEIWNRDNLKNIKIGEHTLHLCPDCFNEYIKTFDELEKEIKQLPIPLNNEDTADIQKAERKFKNAVLKIISRHKENITSKNITQN